MFSTACFSYVDPVMCHTLVRRPRDVPYAQYADREVSHAQYHGTTSSVKPGVHTNDFAPIHRLRALKLGHASLATVFRRGRLTLQPILRENLESPVLRYQPITTAVVTDACLNTRWHHGAYTSAVLRESLGLDRVVTVYVELSRPDWLATVQSGRKQVQSRVCTPSFIDTYSPAYILTILPRFTVCAP